MKVEIGSYSFSIDPEWVLASGLKPFSKTSNHYLYQNKKSVIVVRHDDIDPNIRKKGVPIFKDGKVDGQLLSAKQRVLNILNAIVNDKPLPPIEITDTQNDEYKYKLLHGCHRLHLSIFSGFKSIPAILNTWL